MNCRSGHTMNRPSALLAASCIALAAIGLSGSGCPSTGANSSAPAFAMVTIQNSAFVPKDVTISVGETVRWTNEDPVFHTVTSGGPDDAESGTLFDSGNLIPYDSFNHQFNAVGEFFYYSKLDVGRPGMVGAKVTVTD